MAKGPKNRWAVGPSRELEQPDGSVRMEMDVRRNGKTVGCLILVGTAQTDDFTDLIPWFRPEGE